VSDNIISLNFNLFFTFSRSSAFYSSFRHLQRQRYFYGGLCLKVKSDTEQNQGLLMAEYLFGNKRRILISETKVADESKIAISASIMLSSVYFGADVFPANLAHDL
jgi:hypothetical protein